jgi:hypothetical protein
MLSRRFAARLAFTLAIAGAASCQPRAVAPPRTADAPHALANTPSPVECEALWGRYQAVVPQDPYVDHHAFLARCARCDRAVLTCVERARAAVIELVRGSGGPRDGGGGVPLDDALVERFVRMVVPSRLGICMTRERARYAVRTGELDELARAVAAGRLVAGASGVVVAPGVHASLPWRGMVEDQRAAQLAPAGEVRVRRLPDGRVWLYLLGGLLGRHQNQVGFLYSSGPFAPADFGPGEGGRERACIGPAGGAGDDPPGRRYLLPCFTVVERLGPQLLEVGAAPD